MTTAATTTNRRGYGVFGQPTFPMTGQQARLMFGVVSPVKEPPECVESCDRAEADRETMALPFKEGKKKSKRRSRAATVPAPTSAPPPDDLHARALRQYQAFKRKHPETVLLFRIGDFYEAFQDDARILHRVCGCTLTERQGTGIAMAGVPYHSVETYLRRLIEAGYRVAIVEEQA